MRAAELRKLSPEELAQKSEELRQELFRARVQKATGQLEKTATLRALRRELARCLTVLHQKGVG